MPAGLKVVTTDKVAYSPLCVVVVVWVVWVSVRAGLAGLPVVCLLLTLLLPGIF